MILLIKLLLAHLIGDFILQPKSWVLEKEAKKAAALKLYLHILIHGCLVLLLFWNLRLWIFALLIALSHLLIDVTKLYFQKKSNQTSWFIIDQLLHLIAILILWYVWFHPDVDLWLWVYDPLIWLYVTAILFLSVASGVIIQVVLANWSKNLSSGEDESLANAGKHIGILERLFVFFFMVTGHWEAIGFLLAAKSIFRFGDLKESKDRKLTEYILIGTLLSFGIAIITGKIVLEITSLV